MKKDKMRTHVLYPTLENNFPLVRPSVPIFSHCVFVRSSVRHVFDPPAYVRLSVRHVFDPPAYVCLSVCHIFDPRQKKACVAC